MDLSDLNYTSISQMPKAEAIDLLMSIRLSRRTPVKKVKTPKPNARKASKATAKKALSKMGSKDIKELLAMLGDEI